MRDLSQGTSAKGGINIGIPVIIYGKSGSGKSRSLKNFASDEIFLANVAKKPLPFKSKFKYVYNGDSVDSIVGQMKKMSTNIAVIDDAGYIQTNLFMRGHGSKSANQFDLFNNIADKFYHLIVSVTNELPEDKIVYIMMHETSNDYGAVKLRTIGKLLDEKVCIEGMVTICLRCMTDGTRHYFRTQSDGNDISKSPEDMFPEEIENDLKIVDDTIRKYYGFNKE